MILDTIQYTLTEIDCTGIRPFFNKLLQYFFGAMKNLPQRV